MDSYHTKQTKTHTFNPWDLNGLYKHESTQKTYLSWKHQLLLIISDQEIKAFTWMNELHSYVFQF